MIREKTYEYFKILKTDKKRWYEFYTNNYRITNLRFVNIFCNIERNLEGDFESLSRPILDSAHQEWNKVRVQLKSDLNYLLDHLKTYFDYYEGDHMILFFGAAGKIPFYYVEVPNFFYIAVDVVAFYRLYGNFNIHIPLLVQVLKTQFDEFTQDELKFIAHRVVLSSNRSINYFNEVDLPRHHYDEDFLKSKYRLKTL